MAGWDEILREIQTTPGNFDVVRRKYIHNLAQLTNRNVIAYYSGFLTKATAPNTDINDGDMSGFMNALKDADTSKGLDLILHTPGGSPTAAESIVKYLRTKFNSDIRIIVPHMAMSAGTMIACSGKEIVMGKHSSLGPVDPQLNGIPAYDILSMFNQAKAELVNEPKLLTYWKLLLERYPAPLMYRAVSAINLSSVLVKEWLGTCMFDASKESDRAVIERITNALNEHQDSKAHDRHFDIAKCKKIGLRITDLESDQALQDAVLSLHHSYIFTLDQTATVKIIENQDGKAMISLTKT